jgi:hypothetical protein
MNPKQKLLGRHFAIDEQSKKKNPAKTAYFKRTVSVPATEDLNVCS